MKYSKDVIFFIVTSIYLYTFPAAAGIENQKNTITTSGPVHCENGQWSRQLQKCIPICGRSSRTEVTLKIHGGDNALLEEFPWHAAVYEKPTNNTLICGATIISHHALLSAAHCFYDVHQNRQKNPADYEIGVSKVTRDRFKKDSEMTQFYEVEKLIFNNFHGRKLKFQRDIVIIVTKSKILFNPQVSPICLHPDRNTKIQSNARLDVAGWGVDESGKRTGSPFLKAIRLPYISFDECVDIAPPSIFDYLVTEKFCTGLNVSTLDEGDSGGGLVQEDSANLAYYLVGIVSIRVAEGLAISLNTYVLDYLPWITSKLAEIDVAKSEIVKPPQSDTDVIPMAQEIICDESGQWHVDEIDVNGERVRYKEFRDGCISPNRTIYNIDYDHKFPENVSQRFCHHSSEGVPVPQFTGLQYKCKNKFHSYEPETSESVCFQGVWIPPISRCDRICNPLKPKNVIMNCTYEERTINCDSKLITNTKVVSVSCLPQYKRNNATNSGSIYCGENGEWSGQLMECVPICGRSSRTKATTTINRIEDVKLGEFPWHAGVYQKPKNSALICGATIISPNTLLSAAHCFYDENQNRQKNPADYEIGVSKITRDRFTKDSETTQFYEVETLIFNNFQGEKLRYQRDIVIIVTKNRISFGPQVSPICLFQDSGTVIKDNATLHVTGWRIDKMNKYAESPNLKVTDLPYISFDECAKIAPTSASDYLTAEKFCTTTDDDSIVLSGGGLVLRNTVDSSYYLVGIISLRANGKPAISLNTNALNYSPWITSKLTEIDVAKSEIIKPPQSDSNITSMVQEIVCDKSGQWHVEEIDSKGGRVRYEKFKDGCILPNRTIYNIDYDHKFPENVSQRFCNHSSEDVPVPQFTTLWYKCKNKFHSYEPETSESVCLQGVWVPPISRCDRICSPLKPRNFAVKCTYKKRDISCDSKLIVNTEVVPVSCLPKHGLNVTNNFSTIYCREDGEWSGELVKCGSICGQSSQMKVKQTINRTEDVKLGEFPWHAGVYQKPKNNALICGATIISPNTLLSAAHCFYDANQNRQKNPADYEIGVSKITRDRFTKDSETTQFYEVETLIFNNFQGEKLRYQRDIVIIVTKNRISFGPQVSPICLFEDSGTVIRDNATLHIIGWRIDKMNKYAESPNLKVTHLPYISYEECIKIAPPLALNYLTTEKFCTTSDDSVVLSGGGLVLRNTVDSSYYLVGIISLRANGKPAISFNTDALDYLPWITSKLTEIDVTKK